MKARTCSVHTVLVLVGHARLVVLRPPAAALALAGVLLVHALLLLDPVVVLVEVEASEVVRVHVVRVGVQRHVVIERRATAVRLHTLPRTPPFVVEAGDGEQACTEHTNVMCHVSEHRQEGLRRR